MINEISPISDTDFWKLSAADEWKGFFIRKVLKLQPKTWNTFAASF